MKSKTAISSSAPTAPTRSCVGHSNTEFAPHLEWLTNRFAWYGTEQLFECLSLTFRANADGSFVAHHYRHGSAMSTFVVECDADTWRRAGLDRMTDEESRLYCERVFASDLKATRWHPTNPYGASSRC